MHLFIERLLQFLIPPQCPLCQKFLPEGQRGICIDCLSEIHWIEPPFCSICGTPYLSKEIVDHPCGDCLKKDRYFTIARSIGAYEGPLREGIHRWKYEGKTTLNPYFGQWMVEGLNRYWNLKELDLLIPVPLHKDRLRDRGFNQALLLVKEIQSRTGIPYLKRTLRKRRPTPPQVNLSGVERERGVKGAFEIIKREKIFEKSILLVDDVYTTGATVNECAKVLLRGGAKRVDVLTLARTVKTS